MFTGLIEEVGFIKNVNTSSSGCVLTVSCKKILSDVSLGDSICVNGVCQSIIEFGADYFRTQLSNETLSVSSMKFIKDGDKVNLERALTFNKRLDGHIVNGHVDCLATFIGAKEDGFSKLVSFEIDSNFEKYLVYKASVTVNGVSLTISDLNGKQFSVALIPDTYKNTSLSSLKPGDFVNIEVDILAKYVENFLLLNNNTSKINENLLKENGFI